MATSPSDTHGFAIGFGIALRKAMVKAGVKRGELAEAVGCTVTMIDLYKRGRNLPTSDRAFQMAVYLDAPQLEVMSRQLRFGSCRVCSKKFRRNATRRVYCSPECRRLHHKGVATAERLDPRQAAIDAMCMSCEPEGECRDATCPLRAFSPLPIWQRRGNVA